MGSSRLPSFLGAIVLIILHPSRAAPIGVSVNQTIETYESVESGATPLINFLIYIAVGDVAFSFLIILLLSLPLFLDKSARVRQLVIDAVERKYTSAKGAVDNQLKNVGAAIAFEVEGVEEIIERPKDGAEKEKTISTASGDDVREVQQDPESLQKEESLDEEVQIGLHTSKPGSRVLLIWAALAIALFIAGATLVSIGVDEVFARSVVSVAVDVFNLTTLPATVKGIIVAGLALIAVCDAVVVYVFFFLQPKEFKIRSRTFKNYIGGWDFMTKQTFEIHVVCISLVALVVSVSTIVFALGFTVMVVQIVARILCKAVFNRDLLGEVNVQQICVSIPLVRNGEQVCGADAYELCLSASGFEVQLLAIGAVMIIWCHLIWLVLLVASQTYHLESRVVLRKEEKEKLLADAGA